MTDYWLAIRTAGSRTLACASALAKAGFNAWTPMDITIKREGRSRKRIERPVPILAGYVFANASHQDDLLTICHADISPFPKFSLMRASDGSPARIADQHLTSLRTIERTATAARQTFTEGDAVKVPEGGFQGMTGHIVSQRGKYALVAFPGFPAPIKINVLHLQTISVKQAA